MDFTIGVLAASEEASEQLAAPLVRAGHAVLNAAVNPDDAAAIGARLAAWIGEPAIEVIFGVATDASMAALRPLVTQRLVGFNDVAGADAGWCNTTLVFLLPPADAAALVDKVLTRLGPLLARKPAASDASVAPNVRIPSADTVPPAKTPTTRIPTARQTPPLGFAPKLPDVKVQIPSTAPPSPPTTPRPPQVPAAKAPPPIPSTPKPAAPSPTSATPPTGAPLTSIPHDFDTATPAVAVPKLRAPSAPVVTAEAKSHDFDTATPVVAVPKYRAESAPIVAETKPASVSAAPDAPDEKAPAVAAKPPLPVVRPSVPTLSSADVQAAVVTKPPLPVVKPSAPAAKPPSSPAAKPPRPEPAAGVATAATPPVGSPVTAPGPDFEVATPAVAVPVLRAEPSRAKTPPPVPSRAAAVTPPVPTPVIRPPQPSIILDHSSVIADEASILVEDGLASEAVATKPTHVVSGPPAAVPALPPPPAAAPEPEGELEPPPPRRDRQARLETDVVYPSQPRKRIWPIVLVVGLLGGGAAVAFVLFGNNKAHEPKVAAVDKPHVAVVADAREAEVQAEPVDASGADDTDIEIDPAAGSAVTPRPHPHPTTGAGSASHTTTTTGTTTTGATTTGATTGTTTTGTTTGTSKARPDAGAAATTTTTEPSDGCDQANCVLDNFAQPCCTRWKPRAKDAQPYELDRAAITTGMAGVKAAVIRCGEQSSAAKGIVKIAMTVGGDGRVSEATVAESPDPALGECVASAVRKATFAHTDTGATFTYPFKF